MRCGFFLCLSTCSAGAGAGGAAAGSKRLAPAGDEDEAEQDGERLGDKASASKPIMRWVMEGWGLEHSDPNSCQLQDTLMLVCLILFHMP